MSASPPPPVPRVALRWPSEAARALGVSVDSLERYGVVAQVKLWRLGSIRLIAVRELERLVEDMAEPTLGGDPERRAA